MSQLDTRPLTQDAALPLPPATLPAPQVGMLIKIILHEETNGSTVTSGPWRIAAVSANGQAVWTRSGRQIRLNEPKTKVQLYWPADEFERQIEPVVTGLSTTKEEAE